MTIQIGSVVFYKSPNGNIIKTTVAAVVYTQREHSDDYFVSAVELLNDYVITPEKLFNHFRPEDGKLIKCV